METLNIAEYLIKQERQRQVHEEGYNFTHDDEHQDGSLSVAALCYLNAPDQPLDIRAGREAPLHWPWDDKYWKPEPNNRIKELIKAGALARAEQDRLKRLEYKVTEQIREELTQIIPMDVFNTIVRSAVANAVGWTWDKACTMLDKGEDPAKYEIPALIDLAEQEIML